MTASIRSHPCASGLALRPKRLFGFDGTADEDPRFSTGLVSLRGLGPSSATATALLSPAVLIKLQGGGPQPVHGRASFRTPFGPPDEGGRAQRDGFAKLRSIRHCIADPRHRQFRRPNCKFVRQPKNLKALFSQPGVTERGSRLPPFARPNKRRVGVRRVASHRERRQPKLINKFLTFRKIAV